VVIPGPNFVAVADTAAPQYRRCKAWIDRVCGGLIVALGVRQLIR